MLRLILALALFASVDSHALSLDVKPTLMVLGRDTSAQLTFKGLADAPEKVKVFCTAGEVTQLKPSGPDLVAEWVASPGRGVAKVGRQPSPERGILREVDPPSCGPLLPTIQSQIVFRCSPLPDASCTPRLGGPTNRLPSASRFLPPVFPLR